MEFPPFKSAHKGQDVHPGSKQPSSGAHVHLNLSNKSVVDPNTWSNWLTNNIPMGLKPDALIPMDALNAMLRLTATEIEITAGAQGQNMKTTVTFEGDALQRFASLCKKNAAGGSPYDYEILQEQLVEVGDEFSDEFKLGISAAVAVLLEKKHLEEFLP